MKLVVFNGSFKDAIKWMKKGYGVLPPDYEIVGDKVQKKSAAATADDNIR